MVKPVVVMVELWCSFVVLKIGPLRYLLVVEMGKLVVVTSALMHLDFR